MDHKQNLEPELNNQATSLVFNKLNRKMLLLHKMPPSSNSLIISEKDLPREEPEVSLQLEGNSKLLMIIDLTLLMNKSSRNACVISESACQMLNVTKSSNCLTEMAVVKSLMMNSSEWSEER